MTTQAWRQILSEAVNPFVPASQSTLRLAVVMLAADPRAALTDAQRQWLTDRLRYTPDWQPFTTQEMQRLRAHLMLYMKEYHPRIAEIIQTQFQEAGYGNDRCGETDAPRRTAGGVGRRAL